jgi:hypothetical protein
MQDSSAFQYQRTSFSVRLMFPGIANVSEDSSEWNDLRLVVKVGDPIDVEQVEKLGSLLEARFHAVLVLLIAASGRLKRASRFPVTGGSSCLFYQPSRLRDAAHAYRKGKSPGEIQYLRPALRSS